MFLCTYEELFKRKMSQKEGRQSSDLVEITSDDIEKVTKSDEADKVESDDIGKVTKSHKTDKVELDDIEKVTKSDEADKVESDDIGKVTKSHKTDKVELDDIGKVTKSKGPHKVQSDGKKDAKCIPNTIDWTFQDKFVLDERIWKKLHVGNTLKPVANEFFIRYLNFCLDGIPCVLNKKIGYILVANFFVMEFKCGHKTCSRLYKIEQTGTFSFDVYNNGSEIVHVKKVVRQIRHTQRKIVTKAMVNMLPSEYREFSERGMDKDLRRLGNLQYCPSDDTLDKIRTEALGSLDFDEDDAYDVLKMKLSADLLHEFDHEKDVYIRRFYLDPYMVIAFSNAQFECLKLLLDKFGGLVLFLDATGSVVRHFGKKIYYYAGVIAAKINMTEEEVARLLPIIEFLSGEHDAFNISIPLALYKHHFHLRFGNMEWPIKHCVTDFSFALLNAVCHSWNGMDLLSYINYTYLLATRLYSLQDLKKFGFETFLQLCIAHLSKTHSHDVSKYFPNLDSENTALLKEVFAGFFDMDDIEIMRKAWKDLSVILLSKNVNENVQRSLKSLAKIMTKENINESEGKETKTEEDKLPIDVHEHESMYEKSLFYQNFKSLTYAAEFGTTTTGPINAFYNPQYADVFLKKYVSLLSLWTCITQKERKANACGECHFKNTKQRLINKARSIGSMPLKPGRFLREMEAYSVATSLGVLDEIPRDRCCDYNRKKSTKRTMEDAEKIYPPKKKSLMDIYKTTIRKTSIGSGSTSIQSIVENEPTTSKRDEVDDFIKIGDMSSQEQWNRKKRNKFSYIKKVNLRKVNKNDSQDELKRILEKIPKKKTVTGKTTRTIVMKNNLIDDPGSYFAPKEKFIVSCIGQFLLPNYDYNRLQEKESLTISLVEFVLGIFHREANKIQFEGRKGSSIVENNAGGRGMLKIQKEIVIAVVLNGEHFKLLVVNCKERSFSLVDPMTEDPPETATMFENFKKYISLHNAKYTANKIPQDNWKMNNLNHQIETDEKNTGLLLLNFVSQYLKTGRIDRVISPDEYRSYLQHLILQKSKKMKKKCILCGLNLKAEGTYLTCGSCARGSHKECMDNTGQEFHDGAFHCVICKVDFSG